MNMIYESMRNKGGTILVPSSALDAMNVGTMLGTTAFARRNPDNSATGLEGATASDVASGGTPGSEEPT